MEKRNVDPGEGKVILLHIQPERQRSRLAGRVAMWVGKTNTAEAAKNAEKGFYVFGRRPLRSIPAVSAVDSRVTSTKEAVA